MGGGEVARYMSKYGGKGVAKCALISSIAPALRKDGNNADGVDPSVFEGIKQAIEHDRFEFLNAFFGNFYNKDQTKISEAALAASFNVAAGSSYGAMVKCVDAWLEDFRADVKTITVPTLVIHGDSDRIVPAEASGKRIPQFVKHAHVHIIKNAPHGCIWTHATEVNKALLEFVR
jgi:non-heme chloroperoxidase